MKEEDLVDLRYWLQRLVGEECWDAYLPDARDLQLEIGQRRTVDSKRAVDLGAWGLIVGDGSWRVKLSGGRDIEPEGDLSTTLQRIRGVITKCDVSFPGLNLMIEFDTGLLLEIIPARSSSTDLPFWELFLPDGTYFRVGPDQQITHASAQALP